MERTATARWWLSVAFLLGYVGVFGTWTLWTRPDVIIAATITTVLLGTVAMATAIRQRYFFNSAEAFGYVCILLDVIAEAVLLLRLVKGEENPPKPVFWLCTLAFAVVLGGYRWYRSRRDRTGCS